VGKMRKYTRKEWRSFELTLETSGEDVTFSTRASVCNDDSAVALILPNQFSGSD
jgi:hypothetical protein